MYFDYIVSALKTLPRYYLPAYNPTLKERTLSLQKWTTKTTQKIKVKTNFKIAKKINTQTKQKERPPPKETMQFILCWPAPPEQIHIVLANYSEAWGLPKSMADKLSDTALAYQ